MPIARGGVGDRIAHEAGLRGGVGGAELALVHAAEAPDAAGVVDDAGVRLARAHGDGAREADALAEARHGLRRAAEPLLDAAPGRRRAELPVGVVAPTVDGPARGDGAGVKLPRRDLRRVGEGHGDGRWRVRGGAVAELCAVVAAPASHRAGDHGARVVVARAHAGGGAREGHAGAHGAARAVARGARRRRLAVVVGAPAEDVSADEGAGVARAAREAARRGAAVDAEGRALREAVVRARHVAPARDAGEVAREAHLAHARGPRGRNEVGEPSPQH